MKITHKSRYAGHTFGDLKPLDVFEDCDSRCGPYVKLRGEVTTGWGNANAMSLKDGSFLHCTDDLPATLYPNAELVL